MRDERNEKRRYEWWINKKRSSWREHDQVWEEEEVEVKVSNNL